MRFSIQDLKRVVSKLNLAIEKNKINPKAGWIEIEAYDRGILLKVSNFDYCVKAVVRSEIENSSSLHVTVSSDTFVPLISKIEGDYAELEEQRNALLLTTETSQYTFPLIKENGKAKVLSTIQMDGGNYIDIHTSGENVSSIARKNVKGAVDSLFLRDSTIQSSVYWDNDGALTFTENVYVNNFKSKSESPFKMLLSFTHAKLLDVFSDCEDVRVMLAIQDNYESTTKAQFVSDDVSLTVIIPSMEETDKYPSIRLRKLVDSIKSVHAIIDKKTLDKALARLMVFDKKFGIDIFDYSKIVFGENSLKLVSIKSNNFETIPYLSGENTVVHESVIRFADLATQLKAVQSKTVDISYGESPAIALNYDGLVQLMREISVRGEE